ncbi:hypothetical protein DSOUD_0838 [Desulfuromonas soudanensis]|uniref:Uncharacterized protein n=1 Tax=Desulfuromonas soudanensis TaxID=1603606 RepID=A0A0M4DFS9_9BACT|nr:hypothetical protein [Desulfuromonas soudanensis]ALC15625.1 hypothetical protein DSOUD_0838 [Desulfuromonas soudanensis]
MSDINQEILDWLVNTPPSDGNFKQCLKEANSATVQAAIEFVKEQPANKVKLRALASRLEQCLDGLVEVNNRQSRGLAMDMGTLQAERDAKQAEQAEQTDRERLIAEYHQAIGQIKTANMFAEFANISSLLWIKQMQETKAYKEIGTWENFCKSIGFSRQHIEDQLKNLSALGEKFLQTVCGLGVGYRDLRKLRQLAHDGVVTIDAEAVTVGEERIPMDGDHADELQAAIEKIIESKTQLTQRVEKLEKDVASVVKEETRGLKVERDALVKEIKRLKAFDPEDKDHTWCAQQLKEIHDAVAHLAAMCGRVIIDERALDDPVVLGQVEGFISGAEVLINHLRRQWEENVNLYEA